MLLASPFYPSFFRSCGSVLPFCILAARSVLPFYVLATWSAPALFLSGCFSVFPQKGTFLLCLLFYFFAIGSRSGSPASSVQAALCTHVHCLPLSPDPVFISVQPSTCPGFLFSLLCRSAVLLAPCLSLFRDCIS